MKLTLVLITLFHAVFASQIEVDLIRHLLDPAVYNKGVLPVKDPQDGITVHIDISLYQLIALDNVEQTLDAKVWTRLKWYDEHLTWNSSEHGGITQLRLRPANIWKPDIAMYTELKQVPVADGEILPVKVYSDGRVEWNYQNLIHSACTVYIQDFPWDRQGCPLTYGSWTFPRKQIDIYSLNPTGNLDDLDSNGEFVIAAMPVRRHVQQFLEGGPEFPTVTFWIVLDRKPMYYTFNIMMPAIFISLMCLVGFLLPPDSGERVSLSVTILLSVTVFLLLVIEVVPTQSDSIPHIGIYFGTVIIVMAINVAVTVIVLALHHNGKYKAPLPSCLRKVFLTGLAKYVCFGTTVQKNITRNGNNPESEGVYVISNNAALKQKDTDESSTDDLDNGPKLEPAAGPAYVDDNPDVDDWMLLAVVIDRVFLIIYLVLLFSLTVGVLVSGASHNTDVEEFVDSLDTVSDAQITS